MTEKVRIPIPRTGVLPAEYALAATTDHHTALARRYVEVTGGGTRGVETMFQVVVGSAFSSAKSEVVAQARAEVSAALDAALDLHRKEIEDAAVVETRERFSPGDLQFLLDFYKSADGQRLAELMARPQKNEGQFAQAMSRMMLLAQRLVKAGSAGVGTES